jgi:tetratricopeptide (TPR) repeat protein
VKGTWSAREVAEIVGLQESRVRYWAQTGFVGPSARDSGRAVYTFQDLVGVKAAKELLDGGITMQRARKSLTALRAALPGVDQPLSRLRVLSDGEKVVVRESGATFEPLSGQLVMDFALDALQARVADVRQVAAHEPDRGAYHWFQEGVRLEGLGRDSEACAAYERALAADALLAAAHTNLGNLYHRRGEGERARAAYEAALALDPEQPEARYNLGNLYDELGDPTRAVAEWYRVIAACPKFADAHFNLAAALLGDGAPEPARLHLHRYLQLDPDGEWAARARALLAEI